MLAIRLARRRPKPSTADTQEPPPALAGGASRRPPVPPGGGRRPPGVPRAWQDALRVLLLVAPAFVVGGVAILMAIGWTFPRATRFMVATVLAVDCALVLYVAWYEHNLDRSTARQQPNDR